jgi:hypothetical protein
MTAETRAGSSTRMRCDRPHMRGARPKTAPPHSNHKGGFVGEVSDGDRGAFAIRFLNLQSGYLMQPQNVPYFPLIKRMREPQQSQKLRNSRLDGDDMLRTICVVTLLTISCPFAHVLRKGMSSTGSTWLRQLSLHFAISWKASSLMLSSTHAHPSRRHVREMRTHPPVGTP